MTMLKIIPPGSQDFGDSIAEIIEFRSGKQLKLCKRAAERTAAELLAVLDKAPPRPGEVAVHLIALGAGEYFGPNRNGDYFPEAACIKYKDTFVKHARFYRNHRHHDKSKSYGIVKAAAYNDKAKRIELLVYLNGTKEAADRNGGLIADKELEKLRNGEQIGVSMSCRVPYDVCSGCGNKARSRAEYCDSSMCVKYGGLKYNIGRTFDDGHTLCAINPICDWFDISHVYQPADRIAWVLGHVKHASDKVISGAELAELVLAAQRSSLPKVPVAQQKRALEKLALYERTLSRNSVEYKLLKEAVASRLIPLPPILGRDHQKIDHLFAAMNKHGCVLHPDQFAHVFNRGSFRYALGGVFTRLSQRADIDKLLETNPYMVEGESELDRFVEKHAALNSFVYVAPTSLLVDDKKSCIIKTAGVENVKTAEALALQYGLYQIALLSRYIDHPNCNAMAAMLVTLNRP